MNTKLQVLQLLTSPSAKLLINREEYIAALLEFFPIGSSPKSWGEDPKTYKDHIQEELKEIKVKSSISITTDFASGNIEPDSLAYHRIRGMITSSCYYYFSSKQLELDLIAADNNPNISCHFIHISSGGGEAWYLDRLAGTIHTLAKPIYVLIERLCASAAYYIGCNGTVVKALTQNDIIGCIGTMVGFWDIEPYFESLGFRKIEEYAHVSDLKNKKYNDLKNGNPEQYITEELDPLAEQFLREVRSARKQLANLDEKHPALRGETFDALHAIDAGLVDGITTFPEALSEAYQLGKRWSETAKQRNKALLLINT